MDQDVIVSLSRFTAARGCVSDVAELARTIPLFPVERVMPLATLAAARTNTVPRIGWAALFLKAYGLVAREMPVLRSWLAGGWRRRLATCADNVATVAINRVEEGQDRLYWARLLRPEQRTLPDIQRFIHDCSTGPVAETYKRQLQLETMPGPIRRFILRCNMRSASGKRATRLGTFSLSTLAGLGATNRFHPSLCTTSISYAPLATDGSCLVTLIADHRVLDGATAARALERLERRLLEDLAAEVRGLAPLRPAHPADPAAA